MPLAIESLGSSVIVMLFDLKMSSDHHIML